MDYLKFKEELNNKRSLQHHGVKGMKWGQHIFTEKTAKAIKSASEIGSGPKSIKVKKDYSAISDAELQKRVNRLNLEEQYGRLTGDTKMKRSGKDWIHEILQDTAIIVGMVGTAYGIYKNIKK